MDSYQAPVVAVVIIGGIRNNRCMANGFVSGFVMEFT
jgi:hypothetical protein